MSFVLVPKEIKEKKHRLINSIRGLSCVNPSLVCTLRHALVHLKHVTELNQAMHVNVVD